MQKNLDHALFVTFAVIFFSLSIPMFFFIDGALTMGGFGFMYHYLFGCGIILLGFVYFLLKPEAEYLVSLLKITVIFSLVYIICILWSCVIWSFRFEGSETIIKGLFENVYVLLAAIIAIAIQLMFSDYSLLLTCYAMSIANAMIIIPVFLSDPGEFLSELSQLVITFGEDTGGLMKSIEIHDLTFTFGMFFLHALLDKNVKGRKQILVLSAIFSITGLKRIAAAGIALGAVLFWGLNQTKKYKQFVYLICEIVIIGSFLYLTAVHYGLFDYLETIGLDTKGRNLIYGYINGLFDINPGFMGNGLGFSSKSWNLPFYSKLFQDAYHNEFLKMYVELGFWGYFVWIIFHLPFRIWYLFRNHGKTVGLMYAASAAYCYITYATDNTYYYFYLNFAVFLTMFSTCARKPKEGIHEIIETA